MAVFCSRGERRKGEREREMGGACCQFEGLQKFNAVGVGFAFYLGMFGAVDKRFESFT